MSNYGWENSVSEYRVWERDGRLKEVVFRNHPLGILEIARGFFLITSQRYWSLALYTYGVLSALCIMISLVELWGAPGHYPSKVAVALAFLSFAYALAWNTAIFCTLMWGRHSYAATFAYWQRILGANR